MGEVERSPASGAVGTRGRFPPGYVGIGQKYGEFPLEEDGEPDAPSSAQPRETSGVRMS